MIFPNEPQDQRSVAGHYDSLDPWYLKLWGEHLHHGFWKQGGESPERAVEQLVDLVAEKAVLRGGEQICDIGCGYGATARIFSSKWGARVTGFSLSEKQLSLAREKDPHSTYILSDWLENSLPSGSFDVAVSIESSEHMVDKAQFFREVARVLKPGGALIVCAWLSKESPSAWEKKYLLEPICREGRLPSMGSAADYIRLTQEGGFAPPQWEDISRQVKKTWAICGWRIVKELRSTQFRRFLFDKTATDRAFTKTIFRILAAYQTKSMLYGIFRAVKGR